MSSPNVLRATREHFNCPTAVGAPLETYGGTGTALSHWDTASFRGEMMTGSSDGTVRQVQFRTCCRCLCQCMLVAAVAVAAAAPMARPCSCIWCPDRPDPMLSILEKNVQS